MNPRANRNALSILDVSTTPCQLTTASGLVSMIVTSISVFSSRLSLLARMGAFSVSSFYYLKYLENLNHLYPGKIWKQYLPNIEQQNGLGLDDFSMFTSPWAQTEEDEQFFMETVRSAGKVFLILFK